MGVTLERQRTLSERKHGDILAAASALFLRQGYRGTSMDEVATAAKVSKQTVYKHFADKEDLFRAIVADSTPRSGAIVAGVEAAYASGAGGAERALERTARALIDGALLPEATALRRLAIAEAEQFPDLAAAYYGAGPLTGVGAIMGVLAQARDGGAPLPTDLATAAHDFAHVAVSGLIDLALFFPSQVVPDAVRAERARAAVAVVLRA